MSSSANGSTIEVKGENTISTAFTIGGHHESWNVLGSLIGKVKSPAFTINIAQNSDDKLTDKHTTDISGITHKGNNADGGGLIGYIIHSDAYSRRKINIDNLYFDGCTIGNAATTNGGGLLGYAWLSTDTTIGGTNGITVTNATINNNTPGNVGAMCYVATGKWTVNKLDIKKLTISGGAGSSLGMLVNTAFYEHDSKTDGLYLDVLNSGYTYTTTDISLPTSAVYDELAVYTAQNVLNVLKGRYISNNKTYGAGVISVNMGTRNDSVISVVATGTYQNKMTVQPNANPNSRYYYNLDKMSQSDATQDVVLWSVNRYAASNIKDEFDASEEPLNKSAETNINLTGISFYPVYTASGDTVKNVNITFDYSGLYSAESVGTSNTDSYIRDPGAANQHYLMQSGLFIEQGEGSTLNVNNVSLAGKFLEVGNYNGVLISDTSHGSIVINDLELRGITPKTTRNVDYNSGYLLVNKIRRESKQQLKITLKAENIRTATSESLKYPSQAQVAKSLFGDVYGPDLDISFKSMKLDARAKGTLSNNTALNTAYGTQNSIFTESTFLASLKTDSNSMPYYNYTSEEDWGTNGTGGGRAVTYGKEVVGSVENQGKENKYYKEVIFTDPTGYKPATEYSDFNSNEWLPYVKQAYTANQTPDINGCYYREIRVNIWEPVTSHGCGTYNDPYIINEENANFLENVSQFLRTGNGDKIQTLTLPTNCGDYDTLDENTSGSRWCENKDTHAEFTYNNANNKYTYTPTGGTAISWDADDVRLYLENAYYKIDGSITLSGGENGFVGLGGAPNNDTSGKYAFRGVIVGSNNATITNDSTNPLIMVSNGCVVKNITVVQNADVSLKQYTTGSANASFGYKLPLQESGNNANTGCNYYGGIIGEIMGGDNIIDNCYVTQGNGISVTLDGSQEMLIPVGSYVGVVVYGGLIFKNLSPSDANRNAQAFKVYASGDTDTNLTSSAAKGAIYVNPYVGRVINGYAVNETTQFSVTEDGHYHDDDQTPRTASDGSALTQHSLKNTVKHYSIADINKNETNKLDVTKVASANEDGNINVPNAQAMFVLSFITQSCAGTAQTINDPNSGGTHTDETVEISRTTDENGNVTIYQTRTITDIDDSISSYYNSLSYGTYDDNVYGMSHTANYNDVGTNETASSDYNTCVTYDTAACSALPYIISHYTVGGMNESETSETETTSTSTSIHGDPEKFTGGLNDLDGKKLYITSTDGNKTYSLTSTMKDVSGQNLTNGLATVNADAGTIASGAAKLLFTKITTGSNAGKFTIQDTTSNLYVSFKNGNRNLFMDSSPYYFEITSTGSNQWTIKGDFTSNQYLALRNKDHFCGQGSGFLVFYQYVDEVTKTITTLTTINTITSVFSYPARCVTSTAGYYNINLTGSGTYQLPDSFRGLGCVGIYDAAADTAILTNTAKFGIKLNTFDGKGCTIDEDIYLNKYESDNYFNVLHAGETQLLSGDLEEFKGNGSGGINKNHGIGLFDSVITKNSTSSICNFTLSGSVNTEIYSNTYSNQELSLITTGNADKSMWLSVGGVCGWSGNGIWQNFKKIQLNSLTVSGADFVGGLLGFSGTSSISVLVTVRECSATNISIIMSSANSVNWKSNENNSERARNGMGCFVGKVLEGGVRIYGVADTSEDTLNTDLSKFSTVTIKCFGFTDDSLEYYTTAGGLVGFAGNGCKVYDMKVMPSDGQSITIGSDKTRYAGGLVGLMQPKDTGGSTCVAVFYNCTVQEINVNGHYAGGFYGGKWINNWSPYSIKVDKCQMIGNTSSNNTVTGNNMANNGYAGGFLACGNVYTDGNPNIEITDCKVINYTITSNAATAYVGGFIGYTGAQNTNKSITCYIHDSSVEDCEIGKAGNYAGGAIGRVVRQSAQSKNKILGYNIKLDTITNNGTYKGAWIGFVADDDNTTDIQFNGVGIYGNGFTQNVGNRSSFSNASFVFADYGGDCNSMDTANENKATFNIGSDVTMPKYPYVNVNPQSKMGVHEDSTNAVISGDGAVCLENKVPNYSIYTSGQTMAAQLYEDIRTGTDSRRYTTCGDMLKNDVIANGHKFIYYLQRTKSNDGDRISTYKTEKGNLPNGIDDFTCIMISTNDPDETTNLINQYIRLVTNTTNDYAQSNSYYDVSIQTCKLIKNETTGTGEFKLITDSSDPDYNPGIVCEDGKFKMTETKRNADSSKENTFTLIDVQFKDPFDTSNVAYHLYVPVYTSYQLEVNFSAAIKTGSNSVAYKNNGITSDYEQSINDDEYIHIDNLNTWYTMYLRYSYDKSDLEVLLNSGNLNWNHDKYVILTKIVNDITGMLPENTFMTLVDPNAGSDKIYYANELSTTDFPRENVIENDKQTIRLKLDFKKFKGVDNQQFKVASLNEMIAQNLVANQIEEGATLNGLYDLYEGEGEPADFNEVSYVYVIDSTGKKTYYKYNSNGNGAYNLSFKSGFEKLNEDYYVSVYVPETDMSKIYGYEISIDKQFPAPSAAGTTALPKSASVKTNYKSRLVYLGDLYDQTVTFEVRTSDQVITGSNKILDAYAKTEIKAKSKAILGILASAKNYTSLFHSYVLTLDRHGENGEIMTKIYGLEPREDRTSRVTAWYSFDNPISDSDNPPDSEANYVDVQSNYINVATVKDNDDLMDKIAPNANDITTVTIYSRIRMDFDEMKLETEFPQKTRNDAGVSARVASNLAYDSDSLAFSGSSKSANDNLNHLYYRTSMDTASLYYKAFTPNMDKYDYDGEYSENYTRVGVNGRRSMSEYMPIDTVANYDLSKVSQSWNEADVIRLIISLQKKTDTVEIGKITKVRYEDITDITQYWGGLALTENGKPVERVIGSNGNTKYQLTPTEGTSIWVESNEYKQLIPVNDNTSTIIVDIPKNQADYDTSTDTVELHISFNAKTGTQITNYANYKVNLTAQLLKVTKEEGMEDKEDVLEACNATDYMIYTNAKVNNEFLSAE